MSCQINYGDEITLDGAANFIRRITRSNNVFHRSRSSFRKYVEKDPKKDGSYYFYANGRDFFSEGWKEDEGPCRNYVVHLRVDGHHSNSVTSGDIYEICSGQAAVEPTISFSSQDYLSETNKTDQIIVQCDAWHAKEEMLGHKALLVFTFDGASVSDFTMGLIQQPSPQGSYKIAAFVRQDGGKVQRKEHRRRVQIVHEIDLPEIENDDQSKYHNEIRKILEELLDDDCEDCFNLLEAMRKTGVEYTSQAHRSSPNHQARRDNFADVLDLAADRNRQPTNSKAINEPMDHIPPWRFNLKINGFENGKSYSPSALLGTTLGFLNTQAGIEVRGTMLINAYDYLHNIARVEDGINDGPLDVEKNAERVKRRLIFIIMHEFGHALNLPHPWERDRSACSIKTSEAGELSWTAYPKLYPHGDFALLDEDLIRSEQPDPDYEDAKRRNRKVFYERFFGKDEKGAGLDLEGRYNFSFDEQKHIRNAPYIQIAPGTTSLATCGNDTLTIEAPDTNEPHLELKPDDSMVTSCEDGETYYKLQNYHITNHGELPNVHPCVAQEGGLTKGFLYPFQPFEGKISLSDPTEAETYRRRFSFQDGGLRMLAQFGWDGSDSKVYMSRPLLNGHLPEENLGKILSLPPKESRDIPPILRNFLPEGGRYKMQIVYFARPDLILRSPIQKLKITNSHPQLCKDLSDELCSELSALLTSDDLYILFFAVAESLKLGTAVPYELTTRVTTRIANLRSIVDPESSDRIKILGWIWRLYEKYNAANMLAHNFSNTLAFPNKFDRGELAAQLASTKDKGLVARALLSAALNYQNSAVCAIPDFCGDNPVSSKGVASVLWNYRDRLDSAGKSVLLRNFARLSGGTDFLSTINELSE